MKVTASSRIPIVGGNGATDGCVLIGRKTVVGGSGCRVGHVPGERIGHRPAVTVVGRDHDRVGRSGRGTRIQRSGNAARSGNRKPGWQAGRAERQRVTVDIAEITRDVQVDQVAVQSPIGRDIRIRLRVDR